MNSIFAHTIEQWYEGNHRDLPWRNTRDPYCIWISEIILQQTRVAQGYEYYLRFMQAFPTVQALARASEDEVLLMWQGLGYYSRARNLHKAAKVIDELGGFPSDYSDILKLPGIGEYTAAAIASFSFDKPFAVLDGNVYRVISRYFGIDEAIDSTSGKKVFRSLADEMLDTQHPALYNQAIMEFGALVCTPHTDCANCPLQGSCQAFHTHSVQALPRKERSLKIHNRHLIYIYARANGQILLRRRSGNDIWKGLYEPFLFESEDTPRKLSLKKIMGMLIKRNALSESSVGGAQEMLVTPRFTCLSQGVKHQLSHQLLLADFYLLEAPSSILAEQILAGLFSAIPKKKADNDVSAVDNRPSGETVPSHSQLLEGYLWVDEAKRDEYAVPRLIQELYRKVARHEESGSSS